MALSGNDVIFAKNRPTWWTTDLFSAYPPTPEKAVVEFGCAFTESALREIHQRCGTDTPFDPEKITTYVLVFCDASKGKDITGRRVDVYAFYPNKEERAFTLSPEEARSVLSEYGKNDNFRYGDAIKAVMDEEDRCGDTVGEYVDGVEGDVDMDAVLASVSRIQGKWNVEK